MSLTDSQSSGSVTEWLVLIRQGCPQAAQKLWARYFLRLAEYANARIPESLRTKRDGEDCAIEAFEALFKGVDAGRLDGVSSRDELWLLLTVIAGRRVANHLREEATDRRTHVREFVYSDRKESERFADRLQFGPALMAELQDTIELLFAQLQGQHLREIVRMRLAGHDLGEIAESMNLNPRTVQRKMALIRKMWMEYFPHLIDNPELEL